MAAVNSLLHWDSFENVESDSLVGPYKLTPITNLKQTKEIFFFIHNKRNNIPLYKLIAS